MAPLLMIVTCLIVIGIIVGLFGEDPETGGNLSYAKRAAELCPAISDRVGGLIADGRVTFDEKSIVPTLVEQARAAPGGLEACRID